ncbi:hypothetical protein HK405_003849, partial [Cladochytrium tenue]
MAKIPIVHEVFTGISCLSCLIVGNPDLAAKRGELYLNESVVGSLVHAAVLNVSGKHKEASEALKGAARAGGQAMCLAGLDMKVPVLHELSAAGRSLGHAMAGDLESAATEWTVNHKNDSVLGAFVASRIEKDAKESSRLLERAGRNLGQAAVNVTATALVIGATVATGGMAVGAAAACTGATGAVAGAASNAACAKINGDKIEPGDVLSAAIIGGAAGAAAARKAAKIKSAPAPGDTEYSERIQAQ